MKYTDEEKKPKEDSKPIIRDSTIGGDNYGLQGLANRIAAKRAGMPQASTDTAKGYARGGMVLPQDGPIMPPMDLQGAGFDVGQGGSAPVNMGGAPASIPVPMQTPPPPPVPMAPPPMAAQPPAPAVPPISETATALNKTPDTDYSFYKDLSADDRAALEQRLINQQNSTGSMVARGVAGLGDAISNSYGDKNTSFKKDLMADNELQQKKQLDAFDTHRAQKLQDMQANIEMQKNDPSSPVSAAFRDTLFKLTGQKLPSGMSAAVGIQVIGPAGEIAMKQATLAMQKAQVDATIADKDTERRIEAAKGLQERSFPRKVMEYATGDSDETRLLREEVKGGNKALHSQPVPHGIPDLGGTFNGQKVMKVTRVK